MSKAEWLDRLYPQETPLSVEECQKEVEKNQENLSSAQQRVELLNGATLEVITQTLDFAEQVSQQVTLTRQSVETRLAAIIGLSSVAASVVAAVAAIAASRVKGDLNMLETGVTFIFAGYVVLQLVCAITAAIKGLRRCSYLSLDFDECIPHCNESFVKFLQRRLNVIIELTHVHRTITAQKVTQMEIAYSALQNALKSILIYVMLLLIVFLTRNVIMPFFHERQEEWLFEGRIDVHLVEDDGLVTEYLSDQRDNESPQLPVAESVKRATPVNGWIANSTEGVTSGIWTRYLDDPGIRRTGQLYVWPISQLLSRNFLDGRSLEMGNDL